MPKENDDIALQVAKGIDAEPDIEDGAADDSELPEAKGQAKPTGTDTDSEAGEEDGGSDADLLDDAIGDEDGEDGGDAGEGDSDEGDGEGEARPVPVSETELDTLVEFPDGEKVTLRELREGFKNRIDRNVWLKKTEELSNATKKAQANSERLGKYADAMDYPEVFLAMYMQEMIHKRVLPAKFMQDVNALYTAYEERGEIDTAGNRSRVEIQRERDKVASERRKWNQDQARDIGMRDLKSIKDEFGELSDAHRDLIREEIHAHTALNKSITIREAFDKLRAEKKIVVNRIARLKSAVSKPTGTFKTTIGRPAATQKTRSAMTRDQEAQELWESFHER